MDGGTAVSWFSGAPCTQDLVSGIGTHKTAAFRGDGGSLPGKGQAVLNFLSRASAIPDWKRRRLDRHEETFLVLAVCSDGIVAVPHGMCRGHS